MSALRDRIQIQRATDTPDGMGGQTRTWPTVYTLWAEVKPVRGREAEVHGRMSTIETYLVRIRKGPTITAKDRVVWGGKTLNIRSEPQDRELTRKYLWFEVERGT